jgi:hypothetical protein
MFESVGRTMTTHKQIIIAAIAVSGMLLYAFPAQQLASATNMMEPSPSLELENEPEFGDQDLAQRLVDETRQRIDQDADQRQSQEADQEVEAENELEQTNEAEVDQEETNNQANVIETGDNTATTTQIADNDAIGNALASEAEGGSGGDVKKPKDSYVDSSGGDAESSSSLEVSSEQEAATAQDSSADDNVLVNENTFGDDVAIVDQDNTATQTATAVGIQTQEQDQDLNQYATNVDLTAQLGENVQEANLESTITCILEEGDRQGGGGGDVCF